jgi:hypothetical protein
MPLVAPPNGKLHGLARKLTSASDAELADIAATRRGLILAPLLAAALPIAPSPIRRTRSIPRRPKSYCPIRCCGSRGAPAAL